MFAGRVVCQKALIWIVVGTSEAAGVGVRKKVMRFTLSNTLFYPARLPHLRVPALVPEKRI